MRATPALGFGLLLLLPLVGALTDGERDLADDLEAPVDVAFRRDGALLFAELQTGKVRELRADGSTSGSVVTLPASGGGNGGFTGLATDPDDASVFFVVYSTEKASAEHGKVNRVSRVANGVETVLLDDIPWAEFHVGGRVAVGADGYLYVTTGDNGDYQRQPGDYPGDPAQDPQSLKGKVLRLSRSGEAAGGVAGWNPYVYALGFRNPFGLAVGPDGTMYAAENGITRDEINAVAQGGNYGWPMCEGDCGRSDVRAPLVSWDTSFGTTGLAHMGGTLYMGEVDDGRVHAVDIAARSKSVLWSTAGGPVLDVAAGPDGCLYVSDFSTIYQLDVSGADACRVGPVTPTPTPPTVQPTPSPTVSTPPPSPSPTPGPTPPPTPGTTPTAAPTTEPSPPPSTSPTTVTSPEPSPTQAPTSGATTSIPTATPPTDNGSPNETPQESTAPENGTPGLAPLLVILAAAGLAVVLGRR